MLKIANYVRAKSLEEAYTLAQKRNNVILGGMLWLNMQTRNVSTAIDLSDLGLGTIEEHEDGFTLGAMVTLRDLELHPGLNALTKGAMAESVRHIVGVQFRNMATLGGSLWGRFGFSDVLTLFEVLGARVELYGRGMMDIAEFANLPRGTRDLLVRVHIPKDGRRVVYQTIRNTATDFPTLACAVAEKGGEVVCAIGARPKKAALYPDAEGILKEGITAESAAAFGAWIAKTADFESNLRGSAAYREKICAVLVRRCLLQLKEG